MKKCTNSFNVPKSLLYSDKMLFKVAYFKLYYIAIAWVIYNNKSNQTQCCNKMEIVLALKEGNTIYCIDFQICIVNKATD